MFSEFVKEVTKELEAKESRKRARGADAQISFNYAVGHILTEIWRDVLSYPPRESTINLRSGYYSELCLGPLKLCQYLLCKGVTQDGTETVFG